MNVEHFFMSAFSFDDKVALITGGSRGLGLHIARQICQRGGKAALVARDPEELSQAERPTSRSAAAGHLAFNVTCSIAHKLNRRFAKPSQHFGKIDILINNAGIIEVGPLDHMTREDFERSMGVHFWGPLELTMQVVA